MAKRHAIRKSSRRREPLAVLNAVLVDIDASDPASALRGEIDSRSAGSAADFEHVALRVHVKRVGMSQPFGRGHPAALSDVLAVRRMSDFSFGVAAEVGID